MLPEIYQKLAERYGEEFCYMAGYFDESQPFDKPYSEVFDLPQNEIILQFSGAFYPFHEGHREMIVNALQCFEEKPIVLIHADHLEYRTSKGHFDESKVLRSFDLLTALNIRWMLVCEDNMPNGCSRNFVRLYNELVENGNNVTFLCGGDRANFALTFIDEGRCIVSGRDQEEMYVRYQYLQRDRIKFIPGNNSVSSTKIRITPPSDEVPAIPC